MALWGAALMVLGESTTVTAATRAEVLMAKAAAMAKLGLHDQALSHTTEALDGPWASPAPHAPHPRALGEMLRGSFLLRPLGGAT